MFTLRRKTAIVTVAFLMALAGCSKHSDDFNKIKHVDESEWVIHAQRLPIGRRINLYEELYYSSHPSNTVISSAFRDAPLANFDLIIGHMAKASDGNALSYLPILADLQQNTNVNICGTNRLQTIQQTLSRKSYNREQRDAINTWKLGKCGINL